MIRRWRSAAFDFVASAQPGWWDIYSLFLPYVVVEKRSVAEVRRDYGISQKKLAVINVGFTFYGFLVLVALVFVIALLARLFTSPYPELPDWLEIVIVFVGVYSTFSVFCATSVASYYYLLKKRAIL